MPAPDADARAHSDCLLALIKDQVAAAGGAIPFSRYMELALYAPGLGYYSAGARKFGAAGDFITSPELGPVFAECVAACAADVFGQLGGRTEFLELGGGSGAFAEAALRRLDELGAVPARYLILEPSADLRERQLERLRAALPARLFDRVLWLDGPPEKTWRGFLFANEVIDALPTPRFAIRDGEVFEEYVALDADGGLTRVDQPADALLHAAVRHAERDIGMPFAEGYRSELLPQLPYWIQAVGGLLHDGVMLFIDYGYPRREYYLPPPAPRPRRPLRPARPDRHHRLRGFHRPGRSRRRRRFRPGRLQRAGELPDQLRPARTPGGDRGHRRPGGPAGAHQRSQTPHPAR